MPEPLRSDISGDPFSISNLCTEGGNGRLCFETSCPWEDSPDPEEACVGVAVLDEEVVCEDETKG